MGNDGHESEGCVFVCARVGWHSPLFAFQRLFALKVELLVLFNLHLHERKLVLEHLVVREHICRAPVRQCT